MSSQYGREGGEGGGPSGAAVSGASARGRGLGCRSSRKAAGGSSPPMLPDAGHFAPILPPPLLLPVPMSLLYTPSVDNS